MRISKLFLVILLTICIISGCSSITQLDGESSTSGMVSGTGSSESGDSSAGGEVSIDSEGLDENGNTVAEAEISTVINADEMFTDRDKKTEYKTDSATLIKLEGSSASISGKGARVDGSNVTIYLDGTYVLRGTLNDGTITVDTAGDAKPTIVLDGASVTSSSYAALYVIECDKLFVITQKGTQNVLSNAGAFTQRDDNNVDGAIFSKQDLTLSGEGSLSVSSASEHGIVCKDDLIISGGEYAIEATAGHGIDANDSVRICNATVTVKSGKDGIRSENSDDEPQGFIYVESGSVRIIAGGDGICSLVCTQISGGNVRVTAGGGRASDSTGSASAKGIKSSGAILISSGSITVDSADDAIHANSSVTVSGGTLDITTDDDGIHADYNLSVTNGTINIPCCYEGLEALEIYIIGGEISIVAIDDGLNAAGGNDGSGQGGATPGKDGFGRPGGGRPGGDHGGGDHGGGPMGGASAGGIISISGGNITIRASGDGIDANGRLCISGGYTTVCGPTRGDTAALDYDTAAIITGGTFIGTGAINMARTFSASTQGVVSLNVGSKSEGTEFKLTDSDGNVIVTHCPELSYQMVIISTPEMISGESYTFIIGNDSDDFTAS